MKKLALLLALILCTMMLSGCTDYSAIFSEMFASEETEDGETTDTEEEDTYIAPLTAAKYTDAEAYLKTYKEVKFSDTLETLTERYGEPTLGDSNGHAYYEWVMEDGTGFSAVFFEDNGKLRAKVAHYEDMRQLTEIAHGDNLSLAGNLSDDLSYSTVCQIFGGKGIELLRNASDSTTDATYTRMVTWLDGEGTCVQILFTQEDKIDTVTTGEIGTDEGTGEAPAETEE